VTEGTEAHGRKLRRRRKGRKEGLLPTTDTQLEEQSGILGHPGNISFFQTPASPSLFSLDCIRDGEDLGSRPRSCSCKVSSFCGSRGSGGDINRKLAVYGLSFRLADFFG